MLGRYVKRDVKQSNYKYKMINFDNYTNENKTEHNPNWPYILDHPHRILIAGGSGSGKKCIIKFNKQSARY